MADPIKRKGEPAMDFEQELQALKAKVEEMPGQENKLSMIYTFWGTAALRDPKKKAGGKDFMSKMFGFMLPKGRNKIVLSKMHMAGMGTAMMKGLMKKKNVASLDQLYEIAGMMDVEIKVCEMSMDLMGFKREEIIDYPHLDFCGVATFLANAKESAVQLFI
jgi:peroxiredoxin family protein